jgi:hypothetical protein
MSTIKGVGCVIGAYNTTSTSLLLFFTCPFEMVGCLLLLNQEYVGVAYDMHSQTGSQMMIIVVNRGGVM